MNKKQIGILTFHYAVNPGSALQAFGLCETINNLNQNVECHVINYQETHYRNLFVKFPQKPTMTGLALVVFTSLWYRRYQMFWKDMKNVLKPKQRLDEKGLADIKGYDYIIVGSDQVWNTQLTNRNYNFFLPFVSGVKKISYAASIGLQDFPKDDKKVVARYLQDFSCISVREPSAQSAIENLIGKPAPVVIDPSLLLNKDRYESFAIRPKFKRKYIFLYLRHKDSQIVHYTKKMADMLGLQIVECHNGVRKVLNNSIIVRQPDPRVWLGWIMDAECVFTDSFHGCAFCINLNKPFYVMISSANSEMSSRIYNILDKYQMTDRLINEQSDLMAMRDMNFDDSNKMLDQDRQTALAYLRSSLDLNE